MGSRTAGRNIWSRWKRIAHRAAEIQAVVVLTALYWIVVAPIGMLLRREAPTTAWRTRESATSSSVDAARRQY